MHMPGVSSYKDTGPIASGSTLKTSLNLDYLFKGLISKFYDSVGWGFDT